MALTGKKYESLYATSGGGADQLSSDELTQIESWFDLDKAKGMDYHINHPDFAPLIFQLQQMQDELDYLRTEIAANKDKAGISTAQANAITANTAKKGITSSQESAITANTAKTSFPGLGRTSTTALAGDTKLVFLGANTTYGFSDLIDNRGNFSIRVSATRDFGRGPVTKSIDLRLV